MYQTADGLDVELIRAIVRRDEQSFASLYDRYSAILFGLLLRILRNRMEAEEVLQEVFLEVWYKASDFDETRGRIFTWLVMRTHSRAIDRLRILTRRERTDVRALSFIRTEAPDAVSGVLSLELQEYVRVALTHLPEEQRHALLLTYFEGLTQTEIAERLSLPLGTVKSRVRYGLKNLRESLCRSGLGKKNHARMQPRRRV